jgi:cell division protein FtsW (lipid II flippase)
MNIDELKKEFKQLRMPKMDISINEFKNFSDFVQTIRRQDKDDEKYILHNKILPVIIGLFFVIIIMLLNPLKTVLLLTGLFQIFLGLFVALILLLRDYKNISKETYDLSLLAYLKQKEKRLKSWQATPTKYLWTFIIFVTGLIMMSIGNTGLIRDLGTEPTIAFIVVYLALLATSWIIGEHFYRKRHQKKHLPLLNILSEQIKELGEAENN